MHSLDFEVAGDVETKFIPKCSDFETPDCVGRCEWSRSCRATAGWRRWGPSDEPLGMGALKDGGQRTFVAGLREAAKRSQTPNVQLLCCESYASKVVRHCRWIHVRARRKGNAFYAAEAGRAKSVGNLHVVVRDYRWDGHFRRARLLLELCWMLHRPEVASQCRRRDEEERDRRDPDRNKDNKERDNNNRDSDRNNQDQNNNNNKNNNEQDGSDKSKTEGQKKTSETQKGKENPCLANVVSKVLCPALGVGLGVGIPLSFCLSPDVVYELDLASLLMASVSYSRGGSAYPSEGLHIVNDVATFTCEAGSSVGADSVTFAQTCTCRGAFVVWSDECAVQPCVPDTPCPEAVVGVDGAIAYADSNAAVPGLQPASVATITCTDAAWLADQSIGPTSTCQSDGTWTAAELRCLSTCREDLVAPTFTPGAGSALFSSSGTSTPATATQGQTVTLNCVGDNCQPVPDTATCIGADVWTPLALECDCRTAQCCDSFVSPGCGPVIPVTGSYTLVSGFTDQQGLCDYVFQATGPVRITVQSMDLEDGRDFVEIWDDHGFATFLQDFTGIETGSVTTSTGQFVITYATDFNAASNGFVLLIETL